MKMKKSLFFKSHAHIGQIIGLSHKQFFTTATEIEWNQTQVNHMFMFICSILARRTFKFSSNELFKQNGNNNGHWKLHCVSLADLDYECPCDTFSKILSFLVSFVLVSNSCSKRLAALQSTRMFFFSNNFDTTEDYNIWLKYLSRKIYHQRRH